MPDHIFPGSHAFMSALKEASENATTRFYVQTMTFEGDDAGERLIEMMIKCQAADRCLIIDSYSKVVVNDQFVFSPSSLISPDLRAEIRKGKSLIHKAVDAGIHVLFTNPTGPMMLRYPFRNHKKMIITDDTVFLGGINFSEHNFNWHDMMVRFEDKTAADILSTDFNLNRLGKKTSGVYPYTHGDILLLKRTTPEPYKILFDCFRKARHSIQIYSPYLSDPLLGILKNETNRDIRISIFTPESNNKGVFKKNLMHEARENWFDLYMYQAGMSHLKAVLIDNEILILGSSNYDFASYFFEEEVMITSNDIDLINEFESKIAIPYRKESIPYDGRSTDSGKGQARGGYPISSFVIKNAYRILHAIVYPG